jgi:hypothetical protein
VELFLVIVWFDVDNLAFELLIEACRVVVLSKDGLVLIDWLIADEEREVVEPWPVHVDIVVDESVVACKVVVVV